MNARVNILHLSETAGIGGAETVLLNVVTGLDPARYESTAVLMRHGWLADRLSGASIEPLIMESRYSYDLGFVQRLVALIRDRGINLIHAHLPAGIAYASLAGYVTATPVIATYHGMIHSQGPVGLSDRVKFWLARTLVRRAVAVSDPLRRHLRDEVGFPAAKLVTIHNGIDWGPVGTATDPATIRRELGIEPGTPLIGMVGNLRPAKGYPHFVRAAGRVAESLPEARFLIVGEEEPRIKSELEREIEALGIDRNVLFLGFREDVQVILRSLDVFVLSSLTEGMSIATVEAMGAGIPVVVTRSGGPEDIVQNGVTGILVPPADDGALAGGILELLEDPDRASRMAEAGRADVRARFDVRQMVAKYEALYEECLA